MLSRPSLIAPDHSRSVAIVARDTAAVLVVVAWTVLWARLLWTPSGISWHFFSDGSHALVHSSGLRLYARNPSLQIGPLTFVATAMMTWLPAPTARAVAQVLMTAAGPLMVWWLAPLVQVERRTLRLALAALVVVPAWTVLSVRWMHLDDVLAMVFTVAAIRAVAAGRAPWAGLAIAAAAASKPWALGFAPLLLVLDRRRIVAFAAAGAGLVACWAPFFVMDMQTLRALHPSVGVSADSGLRTFGYRGSRVPSWGRTAQLVAAPLVGLASVLRRRWPGLFIAAFVARLALDPQDAAYYIGAAAMCAVIFDLLATRWTVPCMTIVTVLVLWQPFVPDFSKALTMSHGWSLYWYSHPATVGVAHTVWAVLTIGFVILAPDRWLGTEGTGDLKEARDSVPASNRATGHRRP